MCQMIADIPLPMQLQRADLSENELVGTLPDAWNSLTKVSYRHKSFSLPVDNRMAVLQASGQTYTCPCFVLNTASKILCDVHAQQ